MSEVLMSYERPVTDPDGAIYRARACGRQREDGNWEAWIEFVPADDSPVLRSERETTQPNRTDTEYWATGLSPVYLEGSLRRTLTPRQPVHVAPPERPAYDGPAPVREHLEPRNGGNGRAILDPWAVRAKGGEELLRREISALRGWHLKNIVRDHQLADERQVDVEALTAAELIDLIAEATRPAEAATRPGEAADRSSVRPAQG